MNHDESNWWDINLLFLTNFIVVNSLFFNIICTWITTPQRIPPRKHELVTTPSIQSASLNKTALTRYHLCFLSFLLIYLVQPLIKFNAAFPSGVFNNSIASLSSDVWFNIVSTSAIFGYWAGISFAVRWEYAYLSCRKFLGANIIFSLCHFWFFPHSFCCNKINLIFIH